MKFIKMMGEDHCCPYHQQYVNGQFLEVLKIRIWCSKLFDSAALGCPGMVGWSGTKLRKVSSSLLKISMLSESIFLRVTGRRLKILAPLTERDDSLARLTGAGVLGSTWCGTTVLPLLSLVENDTL